MKTIKFMSAMLTAAAVAFSFGLTSCGNDDDEDDTPDYPQTSKVESYTISYEVKLGQAFYDFYDITVEYTDETGREISQVITKDFSHSINVPARNLVDDYDFEVTGVVKKNHPEIDTTAKYLMSQGGAFSVVEHRTDGSSTSICTNSITASSLTVTGDKMADFLTRRNTIDICNFEWKPNK